MRKKPGFTLIEILIVVAILSLLTLATIYSVTQNLAKSRDARRKADLARLKIAMEDYYGDKNAYPPDPDGSLLECDSESLRPYLSSVPCDPKTNLPYCYVYDNDAPVGQTYKIFASFENENDADIYKLGCEHSSINCGYDAICAAKVGYSKFDYGVSSSDARVISDDVAAGNFVADPSIIPSSTPTSSASPLPSTTPGLYACNADRQCRSFDDPTAAPYFCPRSWYSSNCSSDNYCLTAPSEELCAL